MLSDPDVVLSLLENLGLSATLLCLIARDDNVGNTGCRAFLSW